MTDLTDALDDLAPVAGVRQYAEQLATLRGVAAERQSDYVSLRPSSGGPIAVFVHRSSVSIARDPSLAFAAAQHLPGAVLQHKTPATTYLHVDADVLAQHQQAALTLGSQALDWRSTMPDTTSTGATAISGPPSCPVCHMPELPDGRCHD